MKKPVDSKITDMKECHKSCILKYKPMGYWDPDREPKLRDVLAVFRITSPDGRGPEEAAATLAGELATATWTVVWTDRLTESECYRAKPFKIERVPGSSWFAHIAYDLELFEEDSIADFTTSIIGRAGGGRFTTLCAATAAPSRPASAIN
jgi:ribulose-bisphosphate carboxylase large chain